MTRILLTNDDGIHSAGLVALEKALRAVGDVYVVAPAAEMSGASHSLTLARPLRIRQIDALGRQLAVRPVAALQDETASVALERAWLSAATAA